MHISLTHIRLVIFQCIIMCISVALMIIVLVVNMDVLRLSPSCITTFKEEKGLEDCVGKCEWQGDGHFIAVYINYRPGETAAG